jgi:hypothetical protein
VNDIFDIFLLDLRDFAALLVLFRRFLAMRDPPEACPPYPRRCASRDGGRRQVKWARVF